jgi:hypothetical protein
MFDRGAKIKNDGIAAYGTADALEGRDSSTSAAN